MKEIIYKINNWFNKKNNILIFLVILIGVLIPVLSGTPTHNIYMNLYRIITSPMFQMLFFFACSINVVYLKSEFSQNYNIMTRYSSYPKLMKEFLKDILILTVYLNLIAIILALAGAIIFSFGDTEWIFHSSYNIPMLVFIIFVLMRFILFSAIIHGIGYMIMLKMSKVGMIIWTIIQGSLFYIAPSLSKSIVHFYELPLLPQYYLTKVTYGSFWLEIICTCLYFCILYGIFQMIYHLAKRRKKDFL